MMRRTYGAGSLCVLSALAACTFPALPLLDEDANVVDATSSDANGTVDADHADAIPGPFLRTFGSGANDTVRVAAVLDDEVAIVGVAGSAMQIGNETVGPGLYVAKLAGDGEVRWARGFTGGIAYANGIAMAPNGDVVVVGRLDGTISLGLSTLTSMGSDGFILRFASADGSVTGAKLVGGSTEATGEQWDGLNAVAVDATGNIYVTGHFAGAGSPCGTPRVAGQYFDVFIARYRAIDLGCDWDRVFGADAMDAGHVITTDGVGVFVGASVGGPVDAGGGTFPATTYGDIVVARYTVNGAHTWSQRHDRGSVRGMSVGDGGLFFGGTISGLASFGGPQVGTIGSDDVYFVRLASGTGAHVWSRSYPGGSSVDTFTSLAVRENAMQYAGSFTGQGTYGGNTLNGPAGVTASYDLTTGGHARSTAVGTTAVVGLPSPFGIVTVGTYRGTHTLGGRQVTAVGEDDVFVLRE